jgi:hypothetical protein
MPSLWPAVLVVVLQGTVFVFALVGLIEEFDPWRFVMLMASASLVVIYAPSIFFFAEARRRSSEQPLEPARRERGRHQ